MSLRLSELSRVESADVYKSGKLAGYLGRLVDGVEFSYVDGYEGPAVATTLPLGAPRRTLAAGALPAFFAGLLPEGRRLGLLTRAVKTSADDELTLLLAVGTNTIGDVQVVPSGAAALEAEPMVTAESWSEVSFAKLLALSTGQDEIDRVALPGVQDKVSAGVISVPVAKSRGRYILKLNPPEFPHLVENEAFFLEAARTSGLEVAESQLVHDSSSQPGLVVRRFDREAGIDGVVRGLAQEDGCQVLDRWPADKYRLSTEEVLRGLSGVTGAPVVAAHQLLRQVAFAYLTANGDAHAKNFSVLRRPSGEWVASPAYDIPSTYPYGDHTLALSIGGRREPDITRSRFIELGEAVGVTERAVQSLLDDLVERADLWLPGLEGLPFDERRIYKLKRTIEHRRALLTRRA